MDNPADQSQPQFRASVSPVCPHLKMADDPSLCFRYPSPLNACYQVKPRQEVSLEHQENVCLAGRFNLCPVLAPGFTGRLPADLRGKRPPLFDLRTLLLRVVLVMAILLVLAAGGYALVVTGIIDAILAPIPTPDLRGQSWLAPTDTLSPSPTAGSASQTPTKEAATFSPSPSPSSSPTLTTLDQHPPTLSIPRTGAPAGDIVLGPQSQYLVHVVQQGDMIDSILKTYQITLPVLKKLNAVLEFAGLQPDMALVIIPGLDDVTGLVPLRAVQVKQKTDLIGFLKANQVSQDLFQLYNQLADDPIPAGQWIILPRDTKTPTPTPTATNTRTATPTATITPTQLPPGPSLNMHFGPNNQFLVHMVGDGESLDYICNAYNTSSDVIRKVNFSANQSSLWSGTPLVILPGQKDVSQVVPMQAIFMDQMLKVTDFVNKYKVDETEFRMDNGIVGDWIQAGRWVVILKTVS